MTVFKCTLALAGLSAALSLEASKVHASELDSTSMLQTAVKDRAMQAEVPESSTAQELDETPAYTSKVCESPAAGFKSIEMPLLKNAPELQPSSILSVTQEFIATVPRDIKADRTDPPGADIVRACLGLMTICVVLHGVRRWHLQTQAASRQKAAPTLKQRKHTPVEQEDAWSDLVQAAASGDVTSFQKALKHGPSVKREDAWGCTPLHFAATGGSAEVVTDLLNLGAEVDAMDACDETALHFAARAGHAAVCKVLLAKGANINAVNSQDVSPLIVASRANQADTCRLLLDHGATACGMADEDLPLVVVGQMLQRMFGA